MCDLSSTVAAIVVSGLLMSAIALVGSVALLLRPATLAVVVSPLVAFAAGSLLGGAFFHMIPAAALATPDLGEVFLWTLLGFAVFFALELFLHWHHCERASADCRQPLTTLILLGDGLHNFLGGVGVAGVFLIDVRLGWMAWLAAAAHEVPQELGDFGVLIHGGFGRGAALLWNFLSGLTFLAGSLLTVAASQAVDLVFLVPFAAGSFLYIGASDLVPEINRHRSAAASAIHLIAFLAGIGLLWALRLAVEA
jgi:zinc and cadmium transporter